jgi:magnesium chelatase accessory protein
VFLSIEKPDWSQQGRDWPNRDASRFVQAGALRWHVQVMGDGPVLLLLHGAGAATHSWRDLAPLLARDFTVVAPDLPGHGFTQTPGAEGLSLNGMAAGLQRLLEVLQMRPEMAVGHSAGAALGLRLRLDGVIGEGGLVSLNGALQPFPGAAGHIFPALAKLLFLNPLAVRAFAWRAGQPGAVARLIQSTGSELDARGLDLYGRLMATTGHVAGALGMMANWNLSPLEAQMQRVAPPLTLVAAARDLAVPPRVARAVHARIPHSTLIDWPGLGHLAHEEAPERAAEIIRAAVLNRAPEAVT